MQRAVLARRVQILSRAHVRHVASTDVMMRDAQLAKKTGDQSWTRSRESLGNCRFIERGGTASLNDENRQEARKICEVLWAETALPRDVTKDSFLADAVQAYRLLYEVWTHCDYDHVHERLPFLTGALTTLYEQAQENSMHHCFLPEQHRPVIHGFDVAPGGVFYSVLHNHQLHGLTLSPDECKELEQELLLNSPDLPADMYLSAVACVHADMSLPTPKDDTRIAYSHVCELFFCMPLRLNHQPVKSDWFLEGVRQISGPGETPLMTAPTADGSNVALHADLVPLMFHPPSWYWRATGATPPAELQRAWSTTMQPF